MANPIILDPKQPEEQIIHYADFNPVLQGATEELIGITTVDRDTLVNASIAESLGMANGIFSFKTMNGIIGGRYKITLSVLTEDGETYEIDYWLDVLDLISPWILQPKQPSEIQDKGIDFTSLLQGDTISKVEYIGIDMSTGSSVDVFEDLGNQDNIVSMRLKGGTSGIKYRISQLITTAGGQVFKEDIIMPVKEH